jgi:quaternary ammonium compound-resistance protein SugE
VLVAAAGAAEIAFATCLGASNGFAKVAPSLGVVAFGALAVGLLSMALRDIPLSTGYAAFTAIGAIGTAVIGITVRNEPLTAARAGALALVIASVIALRLTSAGTAA